MSRAQQKVATQERVVKAARLLFGQRGYGKVGIRDVAAHIGMSTGAVFNSFPNKEALFEAAIGRPAPETGRLCLLLWEAAEECKDPDLARQLLQTRIDLAGTEP